MRKPRGRFQISEAVWGGCLDRVVMCANLDCREPMAGLIGARVELDCDVPGIAQLGVVKAAMPSLVTLTGTIPRGSGFCWCVRGAIPGPGHGGTCKVKVPSPPADEQDVPSTARPAARSRHRLVFGFMRTPSRPPDRSLTYRFSAETVIPTHPSPAKFRTRQEGAASIPSMSVRVSASGYAAFRRRSTTCAVADRFGEGRYLSMRDQRK